ncbi:IclR family transcriptional regulator [Streptomyces purpurogeneiscleroticus]|uniref:IclR family transcriptional regulator n=1 Tax=Streptomyces purpurogeneiscleroticus TaxID=68259 RepID=UPI001CC05F40|nr:IclR family transcriptional regulator [Streptomyces purpurogeneiscleroticus]MBZ4016588.1 IclR family transcriptional regulator [Streptomyces purpurogeneiscleroticus]
MATSSATPMRSLDRAFDVLGVLEDARQPLRLSDVARRAELHVATAQRILNVLIDRGYAAKEEAGYVAGPAAVATAHAFLVNNRLSQVALPILQELAATTGLTPTLFVRVGRARVPIARVEGRNPLRYQLPIGDKLPLHLGAGKALLAWLPEEEQAAYTDTVTPFTLASGEQTTADGLTAELRRVKEDGYALAHGERVLDVTSISAPILHGERLLGALSVAGPSSDLPETEHPHLITEVRRAADAIAVRCA